MGLSDNLRHLTRQRDEFLAETAEIDEKRRAIGVLDKRRADLVGLLHQANGAIEALQQLVNQAAVEPPSGPAKKRKGKVGSPTKKR